MHQYGWCVAAGDQLLFKSGRALNRISRIDCETQCTIYVQDMNRDSREHRRKSLRARAAAVGVEGSKFRRGGVEISWIFRRRLICCRCNVALEPCKRRGVGRNFINRTSKLYEWIHRRRWSAMSISWTYSWYRQHGNPPRIWGRSGSNIAEPGAAFFQFWGANSVKNLEQDARGTEKNFAVFCEKLDKLGVKSYADIRILDMSF